MKILLTPIQFESLKRDEQFILILKLTRYLNLILFSYNIYQDSKKNKTIISERQCLNSVMLLAGYIFECFNEKCKPTLYSELEKQFSTYEVFQKEIQPLLTNPVYKDFCNNTLAKVRDNFMFHVDKKVYKTLLNDEKFTFDSFIFLAIENQNVWDSFFQLTDSITYYWIIGHHNDEKRELEMFKGFVETLADMSISFIKACNNLIADYAVEKGWQREDSQVHFN